MLLAFGVACALVERSRSGKGQVVDAAMIDGAATLMSMFFGMQAMGFHHEARGTNMLDGGAHFYDTYETADGKYMAVGAIEPQFYAELIARMGLSAEPLPPQMDRGSWPAMRERLATVFKQKTRAEWTAIFEGSDACVSPVLTMREAAEHPHVRARETLVEAHGVLQPSPSPRFSRTPPALSRPPSNPSADTDDALASWGVSTERIAALRAALAIG
jgi:alpha-methylacyl-CoA racemase